VNGNIMVTGNLVKPSDRRLKSNIEPVSTTSQLKKLEQLKIYDYDVKQMQGSLGETQRERVSTLFLRIYLIC
jgi:hypothetical protein